MVLGEKHGTNYLPYTSFLSLHFSFSPFIGHLQLMCYDLFASSSLRLLFINNRSAVARIATPLIVNP